MPDDSRGQITKLIERVRKHPVMIAFAAVGGAVGTLLIRATEWVSRVDTWTAHRTLPDWTGDFLGLMAPHFPWICYSVSVALVILVFLKRTPTLPPVALQTHAHSTAPAPRIQATLPRVQRGYKEDNGVRLGENPNPHGESCWVVLATFKNQPSSEHAQSRDATRVASSVRLKQAEYFPQTGLWLGSHGRFVDLDIYAPAQSVVLAVVNRDSAELVGDERDGVLGRIDYQMFWIETAKTRHMSNIIVTLVESGSVLAEAEYRLTSSDIPGLAPRVDFVQ